MDVSVVMFAFGEPTTVSPVLPCDSPQQHSAVSRSQLSMLKRYGSTIASELKRYHTHETVPSWQQQ
jgi:hypothetical protein